MKIFLLIVTLFATLTLVSAEGVNLTVTVLSVTPPGGGGGAGGGGGGGPGGGGILPPLSRVSFSGETLPFTNVILLKDGQIETSTVSGVDGTFTILLINIAPGDYLFTLFAKDGSGKTSKPASFAVAVFENTKTDISGIKLFFEKPFFGCPPRGDINDDCRVDIVDFSIVAFWWKRPISVEFARRERQLLNGDGRVDLTDFSIMAYYWTG